MLAQQAGYQAFCCETAKELCNEIRAGAAALLLSEESLNEEIRRLLGAVLDEQPAWSELPLIMLATRLPEKRGDPAALRGIKGAAYHSLLESPFSKNDLIAAVRRALYSRVRQYRMRDELAVRERVEAALRENKAFIDKVLTFSLNGLYIFDLQTNIHTFVNPSYTKLTGYTLPEINTLTKKGYFGLFHPEDRPRIAEHLRDINEAEDGKVLEIECRFKTRNGSWRWFLSCAAVFAREDDGRVSQYIGAFVDVTERRRAEEDLEKTQQLSASLNRIGARIHAGLDSGEILRIIVEEGAAALGCESALLALQQENRWVVRHVHHLPGSLRGVAVEKCELRHLLLALNARRSVLIEDRDFGQSIDYAPLFGQGIRPALAMPIFVRNAPFSVLLFNDHSGGRTFSEAQIEFANQLAAMTACALENVRLLEERKEAENRLKSLNETLEQQVAERTAVAERHARDLRRLAAELDEAEHKERKRLAQLLHDDLQQLLSAVQLRLKMIAEKERDELKRNVGQVEELIGDCLKTSRNLSQELSPPVLQHGGLDEVIQWLGRWFGDKHGLKVLVKIRKGLPLLPEHLRVFFFRAVRELLMNVVKHSGRMEAEIALSYEKKELAIQVEDRGTQFDPQSVSAGLQRPESFGLFNIRERLEAFQGRIEIQRTPQGGACFKLLLPWAAAEERHSARSCPHPTRLIPHRFAASTRKGMIRLLIADDHAIVRQGFLGLLNHQQDFLVIGEAADGLEAVEKAKALNPDAVIMDVDMPEMNGIEATRKIKGQRPEIVVIGLSFHEEASACRAMLAAGAEAYVNKQSAAKDLVEAIRRACRRQDTDFSAPVT